MLNDAPSLLFFWKNFLCDDFVKGRVGRISIGVIDGNPSPITLLEHLLISHPCGLLEALCNGRSSRRSPLDVMP